MRTDKDKGSATPRWTTQVVLPSQRLVGGALCRIEPSITRDGRGPNMSCAHPRSLCRYTQGRNISCSFCVILDPCP